MIMPSLQRLPALLLGLLFLQLTLLGDIGACRAHAMPPARAGVIAMQMEHMDQAGTPSSHDACNSEHDATACASMPSCAVTFSLPMIAAASVASTLPAAALPEPLSIPSQSVAGPDVPPPRG